MTLNACNEEESEGIETEQMPEFVNTPVTTDLGIICPIKIFEVRGGVYTMTYNNQKQFGLLSYKHDSKKFLRLWRMSHAPLNFYYKEDNYSTYLLERFYQNIEQDDYGCIISMEVMQKVDNGNQKQELYTRYTFTYDAKHYLLSINGIDEVDRKYVSTFTWNEDGSLKEWKRYLDDELQDGYTFTYGEQENVGGIFIEEQMANFQDSPFFYFSGLFGRPSSLLPSQAVQLGITGFRFDYEIDKNHILKVKTFLSEDEQSKPMVDSYGY